MRRIIPFFVVGATALLLSGWGFWKKERLSFSLMDRRIEVGTQPRVKFDRAIPRVQGQQYWITVVPIGQEDKAWGLWQYLQPGERVVTLKAPDSPGEWEVRFHDLYPKYNYRVLHREKLLVRGDRVRPREVSAEAPRFALVEDHVPEGVQARVRFDQAVPAVSGQQYWITVIDPSAEDSAWGAWQYVQAGTVEMELKAVGPGNWEVRLHDHYPKVSYGVLQREPLTVGN